MDSPTLAQLIEATRQHLEQNVIPAIRTDPKLYFQTLVAANVLSIAERELTLGADHAAAEWERLNVLNGDDLPMPPRLDALRSALAQRNQALAQAIRQGDYDSDEQAAVLLKYLQAGVNEQLQVSNPRFLARVLSQL
jgi:hypothetical protein